MTKTIHPRLAIVLHDLFMVWAAWTFTYLLRYSIWPESPRIELVSEELLIVLVMQGLVFWFTGLYKGMWRFASLPDLWNIFKSGIFGELVIVLSLFLLNRLEGVPRSVFILYPVALMLLLGTPRIIYRLWKDSLREDKTSRQQRVLILGAGQAAEMLSRDMRRHAQLQPVGFLDDNKRLHGAKLRGIPVMGDMSRVKEIATAIAADMLVIAIPSATNQQMQHLVEVCAQSGLPFRTLPRIQELIAGLSRIGDLKKVAIDDLLGRTPVSLDWNAIRQELNGKRVLVTGGGGSIGSELCRQIVRIGPVELAILDNSEFNLYKIERELHRDFPGLMLDAILGDVCDPMTCDFAVSKFKPDIIFHAAAYKHVPMLQGQIREAMKNNVLGTRAIATAADRFSVTSFVMISTDKAVNPGNVMGASKRVAEIFCQNYNERSATNFTTVRFGNVLNSAGSVVPLFEEQIKRGGPVTVTHPEVSRYFMTIPEACQLILQASVLGNGGEIFVLDMGDPVKIRDLAGQLIRLSGAELGKDIEIVYTGLRPGEKLFEELFHEQEAYGKTSHDKILLAKHRQVNWQLLLKQMAEISQACLVYDVPVLKGLINDLVPELHKQTETSEQSNVVKINNIKQ